MKLQIHELKNLITKKMSKNLKAIAILAIVILAVSCKKENQKPVACKVINLKIGNDSLVLSYNSSNKVSNIKSYNSSWLVNMDFLNDGGYHKQIVTTNTASLPSFTRNFSLNADGNIERFQQIVNDAAGIYDNRVSCKYDAAGHLIVSEIITLKDGIPYVFWKDSMVYENDNLTKFYVLYGGNTGLYNIHRTVLINYSTIANTAGLYVNESLISGNIVGTGRYYEKNYPYFMHLLGKGSKNVPLSSTTTFSSGSGNYSFNYEYTTDAQNLVRSQKIIKTPTSSGYPKTNRFYYECN